MDNEYEVKKEIYSEEITNYPLEHLQLIYGDEIPKILKSLENLKISALDYFGTELDKIKNEYDNYYIEFNKNINRNASKMIKYFKLEEALNNEEDLEKKEMILKINKEKISIIKSIISAHDVIIDVIKQDFRFLKKFLNICQNFDKNNVDIFYEKEFDNMARNWLLLKLNFDNFNFTKTINESTLDQNFKEFIIKTCLCKNLTITVQNPKNYFGEDNKKISLSPEEEKKRRMKKENDIKNIYENQNNIIKLKMKNINEVDAYFIKSTSFAKLKGLLFENITLKNQNIFYLFPYLSKLKIKNCQSLELGIFKIMSTNLKKLYFIKNGFVNYEFRNILKDYLLKSQSIRDNLEILSFANNNITKVDFNQIMTDKKEMFRALKELDFRKNKLTKFIYNKANFPSLNYINLCDNNFNKENFPDINKTLVMEGGNGYLMDEKFRNQYYGKLAKIINNNYNTFNISYLNISYIPRKESNRYLSQLTIGSSVLTSLKKLTLSYNKLSCDTLFTFFSNITEPIYLKKLNLNGNELNDKFFELFLEKNLSSIFPKLKHLSLSLNQIGDSKVEINYKDDLPIKEKNFSKEIYKLRMMYKFIETNKNLTKLNITKNPISEIYTVVPEEMKNADINSKYIDKDSEDRIIINGFFSFLIKIRDELIKGGIEGNVREPINIKFDCRSNINKYSENYPYSDKPIIFKK